MQRQTPVTRPRPGIGRDHTRPPRVETDEVVCGSCVQDGRRRHDRAVRVLGTSHPPRPVSGFEQLDGRFRLYLDRVTPAWLTKNRFAAKLEGSMTDGSLTIWLDLSRVNREP